MFLWGLFSDKANKAKFSTQQAWPLTIWPLFVKRKQLNKVSLHPEFHTSLAHAGVAQMLGHRVPLHPPCRSWGAVVETPHASCLMPPLTTSSSLTVHWCAQERKKSRCKQAQRKLTNDCRRIILGPLAVAQHSGRWMQDSLGERFYGFDAIGQHLADRFEIAPHTSISHDEKSWE